MTDKEIIIDGVDVCECMYFDNAMCQAEKRADGNTITECFGFTCYYKRLKRFEAENKLLKGTLKDKNFVAIVENNEKLEAENAKLKEENYGLNNELLGYKKGVIASENIQLKQTLKEIKSIAQNLYYQSIKDPVKREAATYEIIEKINGILEE